MTKFRLAFIIFALSFSANADEPTIVIDNTPEQGIPAEALAQQHRKPTAQEEALIAKGEIPIKFTSLTDGTIKSVRIRYFSKKIWATEKEAQEYVAGMLKNKASDAHRFQVWSQGAVTPEIECIVEFTEEHRKKLFADNKGCAEGRLLFWDTRCCYRDATGTWSFVTMFDQFHRSHPKGDRRLVKEAKPK
jgi:hypothetical protein